MKSNIKEKIKKTLNLLLIVSLFAFLHSQPIYSGDREEVIGEKNKLPRDHQLCATISRGKSVEPSLTDAIPKTALAPTKPDKAPSPPEGVKPSVRPQEIARPSTIFGPFDGALGQWKSDWGCGVETIVLTTVADRLVLQGLGPDISLKVTGNIATGQEATLFGKSNHKVVLTLSEGKLRLDGSHPSGGSCSSIFRRK